MSKLDELIVRYEKELNDLSVGPVDGNLLRNIAKSLGPSIYLKDASLVSCSDRAETDRVKNNFLIKKLGLADGPALDEAIQAVCNQYKANFRLRVVFYYLLAKRLGKTL